MSRATIMPPLFICVVAVTNGPLPEFFSESTRPEYVPKDVFAIFPPHIVVEGEFPRFHHHALVTFAEDLGNLFGEIAAAHKEQGQQ